MRPALHKTAAIVAILAAGLCAAGEPIGEDPVAARAFLKGLIEPAPLAPEVHRRLEGLLADLGDDTWAVREVASAELLRIGPRAGARVAPLVDSHSAEVASRARQLLRAYTAAQEGRASVLGEAVDLLAREKDPAVADCLVALLGHADADLRHVAEYRLRSITGMRFGYNAHAPEADRRAAVAKWGAWWRQARATFDFVPAEEVPRILGVVTCNSARREICLVGLDGRLIYSRQTIRPPRGAEALPNGHLLVSYYEEKQTHLEEYDPNGQVVWSNRDLALAGMVRDLRRLPNGNTLGIDYTGHRVIEIDRSGSRIAWQHEFGPTSVCAAQRLASGNTLLCSFQGGIREVTPDGRVAWEGGRLGYTRDAEKLPNGNVLVVDYLRNRVVELTVAGKEVWSWGGSAEARVTAASRLPDGRTVVQASSRDGLILIDAAGANATLLPVPNAAFSCYRQFRVAPAGAEGTAKGTWRPPGAL